MNKKNIDIEFDFLVDFLWKELPELGYDIPPVLYTGLVFVGDFRYNRITELGYDAPILLSRVW